MEPTTAVLLLSLLAGAGTAGYLTAAPHDRTYRATRGALGAVSAGVTTGRGTAATAFSRPPARSGKGSSVGVDVGWFFRQIWASLRVGASFVRSLRQGYRQSADVASAWRTAHPHTSLSDRLRRGRGAVVGWLGKAKMLDQLPERIQLRLGAWRRAGLAVGKEEGTDDDNEASHWWTDDMGRDHDDRVSPRPINQNGDTMSTTVDIPSLGVVQEFTSPGQMEEPLDELRAVAEEIAHAMKRLTEGMHDFINGYADAPFTTAALTFAVSSMVEAIGDDGMINVFTFAETLPPVAEAIEEAMTLGEAAVQIDAEGDVEGFKES